MRTFLVIWIGQFASLLGSEMTNFAITIWAWEVTGQATPLSLILFFTQTPRIIAAVFGGVLIDRLPRKQLMILGDLVAGLSTIAILLLVWTDHLAIWHLYCTAAVNGLFGFLQGLAYSASLSLIVPKQHYGRVTALNSIQMSGSFILAPALAGGLYSIIGLVGILKIDIVTFIVAIGTLSMVKIPQPDQREVNNQSIQTIWHQLTFGFRYIFERPSYIALLLFEVANNFFDSLNFAILPVMLLAYTGNSAVFGSLMTTFGIGSLLGAVIISIWGGPKRRIHGVLLGGAISKVCLLLLSLAQGTSQLTAVIFTGGLSSVLPDSSRQAIHLSKVEPAVQGRVFAAGSIIVKIPRSLGAACAGILADNFFEPAMRDGGSLAGIFGGLFGTQTGSGMALMIALFSSCGFLVHLLGYNIPILRDVEDILPDHKRATGISKACDG
ncbi:MAG: MFS transporter [Moorea sp. SIO2I5]|nr:MFS transporter [Moorena sp. SIO2I5]